jgi:hypothetical protein
LNFGKKEVDDFIKNEIEHTQNEIDKSYWANIKSLDIDKSYNLRIKTQEYWDKYKNAIVCKKDKLEKKSRTCELEIDEENFLEAYEFYFNP